MHSELVVLGGGPGGYAAAFLAADRGVEVTIVESDARLGGTCLLRGCIPSKALLHATGALAEARGLSEWGISFDEPSIDADALRKRKEKVVDTLTGGLAQLARKRKVKVVQARGTFAGSTQLKLTGGEQDGEVLDFEHCVLAVGSVPTMPPPMRIGSDRVMDSSGALNLPDVPETLLVVGGGYIGLEMGTVYARLGTAVTVVELLDGLLPGADRDLVRPLARRLEGEFAGIRLKTKVVSLEDLGEGVRVTMEGPDGESSETFSRVLISVGRRPNTSDLGLENTGVELDERGFVVVDRCQRTGDERILAIGDVAGEPMLAHKASAEAKVAVEALAGEQAVFEPRAIPAVVFTDPEIAWAGLTETDAKAEGVEVEVARYPWAASGRAQSLGRTEGVTKLLVDPETDRILGVGIAGVGAGELISEAALAMEMGAVAEDLGETIHPHPTLSETLTFAAEAYLGQAVELYKPKGR
jgi:dihydrolipoamide dehydrogenase